MSSRSKSPARTLHIPRSQIKADLSISETKVNEKVQNVSQVLQNEKNDKVKDKEKEREPNKEKLGNSEKTNTDDSNRKLAQIIISSGLGLGGEPKKEEISDFFTTKDTTTTTTTTDKPEVQNEKTSTDKKPTNDNVDQDEDEYNDDEVKEIGIRKIGGEEVKHFNGNVPFQYDIVDDPPCERRLSMRTENIKKIVFEMTMKRGWWFIPSYDRTGRNLIVKSPPRYITFMDSESNSYTKKKVTAASHIKRMRRSFKKMNGQNGPSVPELGWLVSFTGGEITYLGGNKCSMDGETYIMVPLEDIATMSSIMGRIADSITVMKE